MAKAFKDFNKETKDLIGKNFPAAGSYKVEVKDKAADRTVAIAPTAEFAGEKKSLNIDVEYNMKEYALKTKTAVSASGNVKPKVTYEPAKGHKIETTLMSLSADSDFEVSYEGNVAGFNVTDKVTKKGGDASASYQVVPALTVGASVLFAFKGGFNVTSHSVGARFVQSGVTFNVVATDMKKYVTGVYYPLKLSCCTVKTAVQFTCAKGKFAAAAAVEAPYKIKPCDCEVTLKAKVTNDLAFGFAVIKKLANNWTAVVAMESKECCKFGVQLTRE